MFNKFYWNCDRILIWKKNHNIEKSTTHILDFIVKSFKMWKYLINYLCLHWIVLTRTPVPRKGLRATVITRMCLWHSLSISFYSQVLTICCCRRKILWGSVVRSWWQQLKIYLLRKRNFWTLFVQQDMPLFHVHVPILKVTAFTAC